MSKIQCLSFLDALSKGSTEIAAHSEYIDSIDQIGLDVELGTFNGDPMHPSTRITWEVNVAHVQGDAVEGSFTIIWEEINGTNTWSIDSIDYCM